MQANLSFLQAEEATALNCSKAWESLRKFESFYPSMVFGAQLDEQYSNSRAQCLVLSKQTAEALGLKEGIALDAILLLDRLIHQSQEAFSEVHKLYHLCNFLLCTYKQCACTCLRYSLLIQLSKLYQPDSCLASICQLMLTQKHIRLTAFASMSRQCQERHRHACMQTVIPPTSNLQPSVSMGDADLHQWFGRWKMDVAQAEMNMDTHFALTDVHSATHHCALLMLLCLSCNAPTSSVVHAGFYPSAGGLMLGASRAPWSRLATACFGSAGLGRFCQCTNRSVPWRLAVASSGPSFLQLTLNTGHPPVLALPCTC